MIAAMCQTRLAIGFAAAALLIAPRFAAAAVERPSYAVGDTWHLTDGAYSLLRIDKDVYVFGSMPAGPRGSRREIHLTRDLVPVKVVEDRLVHWQLEPAPRPKWPLEVGRWGSASGVLRTVESPQGRRVTVTWQVAGPDSVGGVSAIRLVYSLESDDARQLRVPGSSRTQWTVVVWYSPAHRMLVRIQSPEVPAMTLEARPESAIAGASQPPPPPAAAPPTRVTPAPTPSPPPAPPTASSPPSSPTPSPTTPAAKPAPPPAPPAQERAAERPAPAPLTVQVQFPADGARFADATTAVAAVITSGAAIESITVAVNGAHVHEESGRSRSSLALNVPVALRDGANAIVVTARDHAGTVRQEVRTVILERAPAAPAARQVARDRWAVVVGIGKYERPEVPRLAYSVRDAEGVYQMLTGPLGFKKDNVMLLTDTTERRPTLRNVKFALGTFLARSAKKNDLVVVFFAGHGAPEVDPRGIEPDGLAKYLVTIDADPNDLYSTALPMDELQVIFSRIEADRVVMFLDACYSGAAGGRTFASQRTRASHVDDVFLDRLTRAKGRAIVTASRANEVSIELPEFGHGVFTHFLLQGLRGSADLDRDGIVSLQELYEYMEQQVSRKSRSVGGNQHPVMKGDMEGVLPLRNLGARP